MYRHVWPNVLPVALANAFLTFAFAIVALASLWFLGLGVGPGTADWGRMLSDSRNLLLDVPEAALAPGIAIVLVAVASTSRATGSRNDLPTAGAPVSAAPPSLSVEGLRIEARLAQGTRTIVRSLDLDVAPGETVGIVGESGSGKSLTARAMIGLLPPVHAGSGPRQRPATSSACRSARSGGARP